MSLFKGSPKMLLRKHAFVIEKKWCTGKDSKLLETWWGVWEYDWKWYREGMKLLLRRSDLCKKTLNWLTIDDPSENMYEI